MDNQKLIEIAQKGEWTLECDRKVLEMMQNLASKIENRALNTKGKMNNMILSLDETKVKMSNLTRINDIKNTVYCENLITDDHLEKISDVPKNTVKLSTNIAIQNGLKLMENSFERHRVNLDPSSNLSEITTVYRPIDKFYTPLPYLIGEKNWKEKWHLGLIEEDKISQSGSVYAESIESNTTTKSRLESDNMLSLDSNLMASQTSLSKSNSSIGDQMVINKQVGIFDEQPITSATVQPSTSSFFPSQPAERKIVNLFDDEPPELNVESAHNRKPANLFDDVDSVASMPIYEQESFDKPLQPVDLFDDNEFNNFIRKIETNQPKHDSEVVKKDEIVKEEKKINSMQANMKNIASEIKNVHLRKNENVSQATNTVIKPVQSTQLIKKVVEQTSNSKTDKSEPNRESLKAELKSSELNTQHENKSISNVKPRQKITNLFDDTDDTEDFFQEIIKQKSQINEYKSSLVQKEKSGIHKPILEKKTINLFDDDTDDFFQEIINQKAQKNESKLSLVTKDESLVRKQIFEKKSVNLFDDRDNFEKSVSTPKSKNLTDIRKNQDFDKDEAYKKLKNDTSDSVNQKKLQMIDNRLHKKLFFENDSMSNLKEIEKTKKGQESEKIIANEIESEQERDSSLSAKTDLPSLIKLPIENKNVDEIKEIGSKSIENEINESHNADKLIIANCQDNDDANYVPKVITEIENKNASINIKDNQNLEQEKNKVSDKSLMLPSVSQTKDFTNPILFLSDEPPDDDDIWDPEDNTFDEPDEREIININTSNYLAFNDIPPEDNKYSALTNSTQPRLSDKSLLQQPENEEQLKSDKNDDKNEKTTIGEKNLFEDDDLPEKPKNKEFTNKSLQKSIIDENFEQNVSNLKTEADIPWMTTNPINELEQNFKPKTEQKNTNTEVKSNVKSKLDIFTKSQDEQATKQDHSSPKKVPGKLNTNLKINVGALMPGARIPKKIQSEDTSESFDKTSFEELDSSSSTDKSVADKSAIVEQSSNQSFSGLLNNDLTKLRPKIQVKRRPSTRKGRRSIYEQNLNDDENESSKKEGSPEFDNAISNLSPTDYLPSNQNIASTNQAESLTDKGSMQNNFMPMAKETISEIFEDDNPLSVDATSHVENKKEETLKIKSRIFYDDEDETRKMLEEEKKKKEEKVANVLFDKNDDQFKTKTTVDETRSNIKPSVTKSKVNSLFDDDSDSDLFAGSKANEIPKQVKTVKKTVASKSLFSEEDDDLFSTSKKKIPDRSSTKIFDSDDEDDLFSSKVKTTASSTPSSTSKSKPTATKKTTNTVVNDPLKDLLEN